jgi:hypothetical protein
VLLAYIIKESRAKIVRMNHSRISQERCSQLHGNPHREGSICGVFGGVFGGVFRGKQNLFVNISHNSLHGCTTRTFILTDNQRCLYSRAELFNRWRYNEVILMYCGQRIFIWSSHYESTFRSMDIQSLSSVIATRALGWSWQYLMNKKWKSGLS